VAVISVVLFHLRVGGFQGGFVGVDAFFVISGYLITRNILPDLATDRFSLIRFDTGRARRILPALIFTVAFIYLLGALWCSPLMFLDLAKECTHALLSIVNIQYWRESHQYFASNSDELALLYCWSLSLVRAVLSGLAALHRRGGADGPAVPGHCDRRACVMAWLGVREHERCACRVLPAAPHLRVRLSPSFSTRAPKRQFSGISRRKGESDQCVGLRNRV
jgi:hypothetical protein